MSARHLFSAAGLAVLLIGSVSVPGARAGSDPPPDITGATPSGLTPGSAVVVRVQGTNLGSTTGLALDRGQVLGHFIVSENEVIIDVVIPDDEALGELTLYLSSPLGATSCSTCLSVVNGPPVCESLNGRNVITGTDAGETLNGTAGGDVICARAGNDTVNGLDGDDVVLAGPGDDIVDAGAGFDRAFGGGGNDVLHAGAADPEEVHGDSGNDVFVPLAAGQDFTAPGPVLFGGPGDDLIDGSAMTGSLEARVAVAIDEIERAQGSNQADDLRGFLVAIGGPGNDMLVADASIASQLRGGGGDDHLVGKAGADDLRGGAGADTLDGGRARDELNGGADADVVYGDSGNDTLRGGAGNDTLRGEGGEDKIEGNAGVDDMTGGNDDDRIDAVDSPAVADARIDGGGEDDRCLIDREDRPAVNRCEAIVR